MAQAGPKPKAKEAAARPGPGIWPGLDAVVYIGPSIPPRDGGPLTKNTVLRLNKQGQVDFRPVRELIAKFPALARLAVPILDVTRARKGLKEPGSAQLQAIEDLTKALAESRKARQGKGGNR